jgi:hypothetical protein
MAEGAHQRAFFSAMKPPEDKVRAALRRGVFAVVCASTLANGPFFAGVSIREAEMGKS